MGERKRLAAYAATLAGLLAALIFDWWHLDILGASAEIGLREMRVCMAGACQEGPLPDEWRFSSVAAITFFVIVADLLVVGGLAIATLLGAPVERVVKPAAALSAAISLLLVLCFFTLEAPLGQAFTGLRLGVLGAFVAATAGSSAALLGGDDAPIETSVLAAARERAPAAHVASAPAPKATVDFQRQIDAATRAAPGRGVASRTAGAAAVDVGRASLRFVIDRGTIDGGGLVLHTVDGQERRVAWSDLTEVRVRRLPPDPPFSKLLLIDLATASGPPVRLLPSSRIDWRQLPGGAAPTARDNARKLIALVRRENPAVTVEAASTGFVEAGAEPTIFGSMRQFAEYDARYG